MNDTEKAHEIINFSLLLLLLLRLLKWKTPKITYKIKAKKEEEA